LFAREIFINGIIPISVLRRLVNSGGILRYVPDISVNVVEYLSEYTLNLLVEPLSPVLSKYTSP
jgi:hypothetical protein